MKKFFSKFLSLFKKKSEIPPSLPEIPLQEKKLVTDLDEFTPEEKAQLEQSLAELSKLFGGDAFISLEDFMEKNGESQVIPFTAADNYSDVKYEMKTHKISAEAWNDMDYIEQLLAYHNQGYEFEGLEPLYRKASGGTELTKEERKQLEQWYILVSLEQVYNV